jgi:TRAP-type uncharacterized transport system substrate-binding protein
MGDGRSLGYTPAPSMAIDLLPRALNRHYLTTVAPILLLLVGVVVLFFRFVEPAPPKTVVIAAGEDEVGLRYYAHLYQEELAQHGVTLEVRKTSGSAENLRLLEDRKSGVHVAFIQGGIEPADDTRLVSLGSLTYTPLWVFYRGEPIDDVAELRGRRIAVGRPGSAPHTLATKLLRVTGASSNPSTEILPLEREEAVQALAEGRLDAVFLVAPAESPHVGKLARTPGVHILHFARAEAYTRHYPYLKTRTLPRGGLDLTADLPPQDKVLLSPTAKLVTRDSLHPALAYLLMRAATEIHGDASLLNRAGEFPAAYGGDFKLSREAKRYYQSGPPLLQRYLPYWAANLVDRLWLMVVPLLAVVLPLVRVIPPLYRWRVRSRIYRWYARLKEVELELDQDPEKVSLQGMLERLEQIEDAVNHIQMPLAFSDNLYSLRQHIDLVRRRIVQRLEWMGGELRKAG